MVAARTGLRSAIRVGALTLKKCVCLFSLLMALPIGASQAVGVEQRLAALQRPFVIDDIFEVSDVNALSTQSYVFAPDGNGLAIVRARPARDSTAYRWRKLTDKVTGDIWLQRSPGTVPVNLTRGEGESGWWAPRWSPGGEWIAVLSTVTGDNVTLWALNALTGERRQLTQRGVDLVDGSQNPAVWLDETHIMCPLMPEGERPLLMSLQEQAQQAAGLAWKKWAQGEGPTRSILDGGIRPDISARPQGQLVIINVADGTTTPLVSHSTRNWHVSPQYIAFLRQTSVYIPTNGDVLRTDEEASYTVEVIKRDGRRVRFHRALPTDVLKDSLRWSPDGRELMFLSFEGSRAQAPLLFLANATTGSVTRIALGSLDIAPEFVKHSRSQPRLEWVGKRRWLVRGFHRRNEESQSRRDVRRDWWLVDDQGNSRLLSGEMQSPPSQVWPEKGTNRFFGAADGELWRMDPLNEGVHNLTATFESKVTGIAWPTTDMPEPQYSLDNRTAYSEVVFNVSGSASGEPYLMDLRTERITALKQPVGETATLVAFEPTNASAIYARSSREGTAAWRSTLSAGDITTRLYESNAFLSDIAEGEFKLLEYTALSGEKLLGWIILPLGYEPGKRYPLITYVYAGNVQGPTTPVLHSISGLTPLNSLNMQVAAAAGYAVLLPSMPLKPFGAADDPMLELPNGVLPAVDKVVELGIADPKRLYVMGHSFGGFSTYGLVTQTKRFAAAVSCAGLSNLISLYGQFDARLRYTEHPLDHALLPSIMESGQALMAGPPWKDYSRYIRNSPIFYVDRVETPLLIIQGDMDYIGLQQGEEFFTSLYRRDKRVRLIRYWGEGHALGSPVNVRDLWQQIFKWFELFPGPPT